MREFGKMYLPNFLIIGAAKSGTTSLYHYLNEHPDIFLPEIKEPHFFVKEKVKNKIHKWVDRYEDYLKLFENTGTHSRRGEASVLYLYYYDEAIKNIKHFLGESVKIIIIIRNPIDRAYSGYRDCYRANPKENLSFEEALKVEDDRKKIDNYAPTMHYKSIGLYYNMVSAYMRNFKNVKIILFDDFVKEPERIMKELFQYLEVFPFKNKTINKKHNVGGRNWNSQLMGMFFKRIALRSIRENMKRHYPGLYKKMGLFVNKLFMKKVSDIKPDTRKYLSEFYKNDIEKLSGLIGIDLNYWVSQNK